MTSIGNDLFRNWLKELAPVARTQQMGEIAKSQAAKGLQGSAIKASLAQLSQRCRVMLVPLTEKEINYFTRRNPVVKPERTNNCTKEKNISSSLASANDIPMVKPKKQTTIISEHSNMPSKVPKDQNLGIQNLSTSKKANTKLKRKFEELFGHDPEESSFQHNKAISGQNNSNVNYVSTTLHVNIFTNGTSKVDFSNKKELKRKKSGIEGQKTKNPPKKLRINVSLPNDELYSEGNVDIDGIQFSNGSIVSKTACAKKKTKQKRNPSKTKAKKPKIKHAIPSLLSTKNIVEEDSTIKELWSILGMESPTDRSESIKNGDSGKSVIHHHDDDKTRFQSQPSSPTEKETLDSDAVCQISETFSLAHLSEMHDLHFLSTSSGASGNIENSSSFKGRSSKSKSEQENVNRKDCDEILHQNVNSSDLCETNKIGTIRVKSIDLLMNPTASPVCIPMKQLESTPANVTDAHRHVLSSSASQTKATSVGATSEKSTLQNDIEPSCGLEDTEDSKKCFFTTYQFYFNKFVESKIPKLGEILHLAIGDEIRRKERIKAATQLSSQHFVVEEKQRACNDFRDVMKLRGEEFAPPFCSIFQGFEENSQVTLFFALLYRVLKNAIQIDSRHKHCILEAKTVILTMLSLSNIENSNIVSILNSDVNEFVEQLNLISSLVDEYYLVNTIERQLNSSKRSEHEGLSCQNTAYRGKVTGNVLVENNDGNITQNNAMPRSQYLLLNSNKNTPPIVPDICAIPSTVHYRGNPTEAQSRLSPSKAGTPTIISSINTVNKETRSSAQHRPQPSQIPFSNANASLNQTSLSTPMSSIPSSSNTDLNKMILPNKAVNQGSLAHISSSNHNSRTISGDPVRIMLLDRASSTNHEIISKEANPSNRNTNIIMRMPLDSLKTSSVNPALQVRPVSVHRIPNNTNLQNKLINTTSDSKSSKSNLSLTSNVGSPASQSSVNNIKTYQQTVRVNLASRTTANEKRSVPGLLEMRSGELNCKDATVPVNVQSQVVPSSSHCHPFVKRMPISGKMRMFCDNN